MLIDPKTLPPFCFLKKGVFFIIDKRHAEDAGWSTREEVARYDNGAEAAAELERLYKIASRKKQAVQFSMRCSIFT